MNQLQQQGVQESRSNRKIKALKEALSCQIFRVQHEHLAMNWGGDSAKHFTCGFCGLPLQLDDAGIFVIAAGVPNTFVRIDCCGYGQPAAIRERWKNHYNTNIKPVLKRWE